MRAYEHLVQGRVEQVTLEELAGRTVATGVVPYPPGIPLLMPGENAGPADGPVLGYLKALEAYDRRFRASRTIRTAWKSRTARTACIA